MVRSRTEGKNVFSGKHILLALDPGVKAQMSQTALPVD